MVLVGTLNKSIHGAWLKDIIKKNPVGSCILGVGEGELHYKPLCGYFGHVNRGFAQYVSEGDGKDLQMDACDQTKSDIVSSITVISELDGSFDAVMSINVFEHLSEPVKAIKEFVWLLRGCPYIITAPFCNLTHFASYHFYTGFNRYFYQVFYIGSVHEGGG